MTKNEKKFTIRFTNGKEHFYDFTGIKVFHARCDRTVILRKIGKRTEGSDIVHLDDEYTFRKLVILAGLKQCLNNTLDIEDIVDRLDEYSMYFWYYEMIKAYKEGHTCRVAKAFQILHGGD